MLNSISHVWEFPLVYCLSFNDPMYDISSNLTCNHQPWYIWECTTSNLFPCFQEEPKYTLYIFQSDLHCSGIPKIFHRHIIQNWPLWWLNCGLYSNRILHYFPLSELSVSHRRAISTFLNYLMISGMKTIYFLKTYHPGWPPWPLLPPDHLDHPD